MNVLLERFCYTPLGTVGRMTVGDGEFKCYTIERPWWNNIPSESCIPVGEYSMKLGVFHARGYPAWEILDVPGRTLIKIHRGNTMLDLKGCIAPGQGVALMNDLWAVSDSRRAFSDFMEAMGSRTLVSIKIVNAFTEGETIT